jgi:pteridine reductase
MGRMPESKVALVTGGAKRVGRAIALRLARGGYDLLVTYRNSKSEADSLAAEVHALGRRCRLVAVDFTDPGAPDQVHAAFAESGLGRLDLLVHNASVFPKARLEATTAAMIAECHAVHVAVPLLLTRLLAPALRESRGSVLSLVDLVADRGFADYVAYAASKAALVSLTLSWAKGLAPHSRANAIAPGAVDFPIDMPESERNAFLSRVPLRRQGDPADIAEAAFFLANDAPYITGTVLRVDGGKWLG